VTPTKAVKAASPLKIKLAQLGEWYITDKMMNDLRSPSCFIDDESGNIDIHIRLRPLIGDTPVYIFNYIETQLLVSDKGYLHELCIRDPKIIGARYLFFPRHEKNHYYAVLYDLNLKLFLAYDSNHNSCEQEAYEFAQDMHNQYFSETKFTFRMVKNHPQQLNKRMDCLNYSISFCEYSLHMIKIYRTDKIECYDDKLSQVDYFNSRINMLKRFEEYLGKKKK